MKLLHVLACTAIASAGLAAPTATFASVGATSLDLLSIDVAPIVSEDDGSYEEARRGRGRGRGGDRDRSDRDDRRDDRSRGRDRPRTPGGSGCDDPGDILEHSQCQGGGSGATTGGSSSGGGHGGRPRIPGGSGCDDPHDVAEHPECRL